MLWIWAWAAASIVPLSDVSYDVAVSGPLAEITLTQTFRNDSAYTTEATFVFPLHERAVVDAMVMRLDDRSIEGRIEEKQAALEAYREALAQGKTAALTENLRWDLFQQRVGNIPPGTAIEVSLRVIQPVHRLDGRYRLELPLSTGARFVDPGQTVDEALQAAPPAEVKAQVHVRVEGGMELRDFRVESHTAFAAPTGAGWETHAADLAMDRDFAVSWSTATNRPQIGALHDGEHLLLLFEPPNGMPYGARRPRRLIFIYDLERDRAGWSHAQSAVTRATETLQDPDLAGSCEQTGRIWMGNTAEQGRDLALRGARYAPMTDSLLLSCLDAALSAVPLPSHDTYIVVFSDGLGPNALEALERVARYDGPFRVHAVGVGRAVDRFTLGQLATLGGGRLFLTGRPGGVDALVEALDRPVFSNVEVDWGDWGVEDLAVERIPDLHLGQPVELLARTRYEEGGPIGVSGWFGSERIGGAVRPEPIPRGRAIASTWARQRIETLGRRQIRTGIPARDEGLPLALEYQILSPWTAFVAIDPRVRDPHPPPEEPVEPEESEEPEPEPKPLSKPPRGRLGSGAYNYQRATIDTEPASAEIVLLKRSAAPSTSQLELGGGWVGGQPRFDVGLSGGVYERDQPFGLHVDSALSWYRLRGATWRSLPVLARAKLERSGNGVFLEAGGIGQHVSGPLPDATEARRVGWHGALRGRFQRFRAGLEATSQRYRLDDGEPVDRQTARLALRQGFGRGAGGGFAELGGQITGLAGQATPLSSVKLGFHLEDRVYVRATTGGAVLSKGELGALPTGALELGWRRDTTRIGVHVARTVDFEAPEQALPTGTAAGLVARAGGRDTPAKATLRLDWRRNTGPLALPVERAFTPSEAAWSRDALVGELVLETQPAHADVYLALTARGTAVLRSDADLQSPLALWVPGLLVAHRPLFTQLETLVPTTLFRRVPVGLELAGGLASPIPGDRAWSGWQAEVRPGLRIGFDDRRVSWLRLTGLYRSGRVGDPRLDREDGWLDPDRIGRWGITGHLTLGF